MTKLTWTFRQHAFRSALRELRVGASLSQAELANLLGKPQSFVSKYENGERRLEYVEIELICLACGTTLSAFAKLFEDQHPAVHGMLP